MKMDMSSLVKLQSFVEENSTQFGGIFFDEVSNSVHVNIVDDTTAETMRRVRAMTVDSGVSSSTPDVVLRKVKYSTAELGDVKRQITTKEPWASLTKDVRSSWGIDPRINKVRIGLIAITSALQREADRTFGDMVKLVTEDRPSFPSEVTPLPKGVKIVHVE